MSLINIYNNILQSSPIFVQRVPLVPFDLDGALIVCDGNSLTAGYLASDNAHKYPSQLQLAIPGAEVINLGVNSDTTTGMIARGSVTDSYFTSGGILIAWEFINETSIHPAYSPLSYDKFVEYCLDRKAAGWRVVVMTCQAIVKNFAGDTSEDYMNFLREFNQQLRNNYLDFADDLIDLAAQPSLSIMNDIFFNADQIHNNDNGYLLISQIVANYLTS